MTAAFDEDEGILCGGFSDVFQGCFGGVKDFYHFNRHSYFAFLEDYRHGPCDSPFEIPCIHIFIGFFVAVIGVTVDCVGFALIVVLKILPAIVRAYYMLWKGYLEKCADETLIALMFFPLFVAANALVIPLLVLSAALFIIMGMFYGLYAAAQAYQKDSILAGIAYSVEKVRKFDLDSSQLLFDAECACLFCCTPCSDGGRAELDDVVAHDYQPQDNNNNNNNGAGGYEQWGGGLMRMAEVWNSFFEQCTQQTCVLLDLGYISQDDINDSEPFLFISIPAYVALSAVRRSIEANSPGIVLATQQAVTDHNRPRNFVADRVYVPLLAAKAILEQLELTPEEWDAFQRYMAVNNQRGADGAPLLERMPANRRKRVLEAYSKIIGVATAVSRVPMFHRRFGGALHNALDAKQR